MKRIVVIAMVLMALSFALTAKKMDKKPMGDDCADCKQHEMKMGPGHEMGKDMFKELNLTKEQKKKLDVLRDDHMKVVNVKKAELKNLHIDKQNAMKAEDYAKVKQLNKTISDKELELDNLMVDHKQAMLKELTAEQKAKLQDMRPMGKGMDKGQHKGMNDSGKGHCK
jgi:Spy/CpxP family protein refolding chaperone